MARFRRLTRRPDFLAAARGRRFHTDRLTAQGRLREPDETRAGATAEGLHFGLTVTKRVGHASERNRIRRRLRAALDRLVEVFDGACPANGADIVLIARRPALDAPFETLLDDLRRAVRAVTRPPGRSPSPHAPHARPGRGEALVGADRGDAATGVRSGSGAHVPRRANPRDRAGDASGAGPGSDAAHQSSLGSKHGSSDG